MEYERVEATRTPVIPISNIITLSEFEQPVSAGKGVYLGDGSQTITREVPNTEETRKKRTLFYVYLVIVWNPSILTETGF